MKIEDFKKLENYTWPYAKANPVFISGLLKEIENKNPLNEKSIKYFEDIKVKFLKYTFGEFYSYSKSESFDSSFNEKFVDLYPDKNFKLKKISHVFPVYSYPFDISLMVPLSIESSDDWDISDAFGSFESIFENVSRDFSFIEILKVIENRWSRLNKKKFLPLRWRKALKFKILCSVHLDVIAGNSFQLPLIIATLRALSLTHQSVSTIPFGNKPVFATGELLPEKENYSFKKIKFLDKKAEGFIREYGEGLPAVLQSQQIVELEKRGLLKKFNPVREADSLDQLMQIEEISVALSQLASPPDLVEIDSLLEKMTQSQRSIRFSDTNGLCQWMLSSETISPYYVFKVNRHAGFVPLHRGMFFKASEKLNICKGLLARHPELFGLNDHCALLAALGTLAFDSCEPKLALKELESLKPILQYLTIDKKASYWGTKCQLYRLQGDFDKAVEAGRQATRFADLGKTGESHRDRNYLIHALLKRIGQKGEGEQCHKDVNELESLIKESEGVWAPKDIGPYRANRTFCLHYRAELARLLERPFDLPDKPPWEGDWGHAWLFALLSCARNRAHTLYRRKEYIGKLVNADVFKNQPNESLYFALIQVYKIYANSLNNRSIDEPLKDLHDWCQHHAREGFPGWKTRLSPVISMLKNKEPNSSERLCDIIPFH